MARRGSGGNARYLFIQSVAQLPSVRAKVAAVRDAKAQQAAALAQAEGLTVTITTSEGTRPKGRPYGRIAIPAEDEFGTDRRPRTRLLGRIVS